MELMYELNGETNTQFASACFARCWLNCDYGNPTWC